MENTEILGRLFLWKRAFDDAHALLSTAFRADIGKKQSAQKEDALKYIKNHEEFMKLNPDADISQFNSQYIRPFPTIEECYIINNVCVEHSINCFCKVFNIGHGLPGAVSKNDQKFRDEHLPKIKAIAFESENEQFWFDELCRRAREVRDTMISHTDGNKYPIKYSGRHTSISSPKKLWELIPLDQFQSMLSLLSKAVEQYMDSFSKEHKINN